MKLNPLGVICAILIWYIVVSLFGSGSEAYLPSFVAGALHQIFGGRYAPLIFKEKL